VTKATRITVALARAAAAFALSLSTAAPVVAADWSPAVVAVPATYVGELGTRFWFGRAKTKKDLFDTSGTMLVSRLDYYDMNIFTGEAFSRLDFNNGWFVKGYFGGGGLFSGKLKDEDFPPVVSPYSATLSDNKSGSLIYGSIDAGIKLVRGPDFHVGAFAGYHFLRDYVDAMGCTQVGANPNICTPAVPDSIRGISQTNNWHSLRLGFEASAEFAQHWKVTVDAAWAPFASSMARTRTSCGSAAIPATSPARFRRTVRAGATSSTPSFPIASTIGSMWVPAAATGTSRPRVTPISRDMSLASTRSRRSCSGGPITSAASSRPISSSVRTGWSAATNERRLPVYDR
jgi:hypothetical protein